MFKRLRVVRIVVNSVEDTIDKLFKKGVRLSNADPGARATGANVFIRPKSARGLLVELLEEPT